MLTAPDFIHLLAGLIESLPHHKALSELGLSFAWSSLPDLAKRQLTPQLIAYAAKQRLLDPEPREKLAIHVQLLVYLYPLHNGMPAVEQGLRPDLDERLRQPDRFHPLVTIEAHRRVLVPCEPEPVPVMSTSELFRHLSQLASQTGVKL
jgi:hypothetical protein